MFLLVSLHSYFLVSECPHENIAKVLKLPSFVTANLLFTQPIYERIIVGNQYCDIPLGTCYLIRGENVVMMGRVVSFLGFCFFVFLFLALFLLLPSTSTPPLSHYCFCLSADFADLVACCFFFRTKRRSFRRICNLSLKKR